MSGRRQAQQGCSCDERWRGRGTANAGWPLWALLLPARSPGPAAIPSSPPAPAPAARRAISPRRRCRPASAPTAPRWTTQPSTGGTGFTRMRAGGPPTTCSASCRPSTAPCRRASLLLQSGRAGAGGGALPAAHGLGCLDVAPPPCMQCRRWRMSAGRWESCAAASPIFPPAPLAPPRWRAASWGSHSTARASTPTLRRWAHR